MNEFFTSSLAAEVTETWRSTAISGSPVPVSTGPLVPYMVTVAVAILQYSYETIASY